jgi:hypothetical protein
MSNGFLARNLGTPGEAVKTSRTVATDLFVTLGIQASCWQDEHRLAIEKRIVRD